MSQKYLNSQFYKTNRDRLRMLMEDDAIAVVFSNDMMPRNGDQYFPFRQNSDLLYLTGIDQEETVLLFFPDSPLEQFREVLFIRKTNEKIATWEGHKYTQEEAAKISGIKNVMWLESFQSVLKQASSLSSKFYLNKNEHPGAPENVESKQLREGKRIKEKYPFHQYYRLAPLMKELRLVKQQAEINTMQQACDITADAFKRVLKFVKPGLKESQVEAEITHEFLRSGAQGHAYAPIVASGKNATVLHYTANNQTINNGDLILFDIGCEYMNYASDMSRTIPVNGKFSARQKEVYNAVLRVFQQAKEMIKPGTSINQINNNVEQLLMEEHIKLGLYSRKDIQDNEKANELIKTYYPHGTSHFMGLDVHDVGTKYERLEAGMVLSCEPGIYIREENIGVRIENDILVTMEKPLDLMADVPITVDEIENFMNDAG
ncbi:MAG: aminopeptidase P family protein [Bacteroidales bacterium]|nr:aminopeptidase P family protein [Bacteroidales bacterium]